ncbi:MAG: thioesterase [Betaproteobacteria bacterium]|nr:thioesterase [Betaproteobacteria bacterium]
MGEDYSLKLGIRGTQELKVAREHLASNFGSGLVDVLSTPTMIGFMEGTASDSVQALLPEGHSTVGTSVDIKHLAATPPGMKVRFHSELTEIDGRMLTFKVWAEDEQERIGEGIHQRAVIDRARFLAKLAKKAGSAA